MMDGNEKTMGTSHKSKTMSCKSSRKELAELLLAESGAAAESRPAARLADHLAACAACRAELAELRATYALLGEWTAPEPSAYFDTRLQVRLREAVAARPEGLLERTRSFFLFSTGRPLRSAMAGALGVALLLGAGGTFAGLHGTAPTPQASATVNDLKILDNNAQALQQMDQLLEESTPSAEPNAAPPTT